MKITSDNYYDIYGTLDQKGMPEALAMGHDLVGKVTSNGANWDKYKANATYLRIIDDYFLKLEEYIEFQKSASQSNVNKGKSNKNANAKTRKEIDKVQKPKKENKKADSQSIKKNTSNQSATKTGEQKKAETKRNSTPYSKEKAKEVFDRFVESHISKIAKMWVNPKLKSTKPLRDFKDDMTAISWTEPYKSAKSFEKFWKDLDELFEGLKKWIDEHEDSHKKSDWADYLGSYEYIRDRGRELYSTNSKKKPTVVKRSKTSSTNPTAKKVEKISDELKFIRRYVNMNGKDKTRNQIRLFVNALQKAIRERRITKSSVFAKAIMKIQKGLIIAHKGFKNDVETKPISISEGTMSEFLPLLGKQMEMQSVKFIKSYINLQGKVISNKQAHSLHTRITRAYNSGKITKKDKYWSELESILEQLAAFIEKNPNEGVLRIESRELNGLSGIVNGCPCGDSLNGFDTIPERTIMNSMDIVKLNFKKLDFKGKWREFIGNPSKGFSAMIFAKPKMGKSYMSVDWAGYLANNHGTVLYVAKEEGIDETLQKKLREKAVMHPDLYVANYMPEDLSKYDFVFLDSITKLKLTPSDLSVLESRYPNISFISIFQVTKSGNFRGNNGFQHEVDVVIEIPEKGKAIQYGRFNQGGEMDVFDDMAA